MKILLFCCHCIIRDGHHGSQSGRNLALRQRTLTAISVKGSFVNIVQSWLEMEQKLIRPWDLQVSPASSPPLMWGLPCAQSVADGDVSNGKKWRLRKEENLAPQVLLHIRKLSVPPQVLAEICGHFDPELLAQGQIHLIRYQIVV